MNNNYNPFNHNSPLFPFRWMVIIGAAVTMLLSYYNLNGERLFTWGASNTWTSSGPGYHK